MVIAQIKEATDWGRELVTTVPQMSAIILVVALFLWYMVRLENRGDEREKRRDAATKEKQDAAIGTIKEMHETTIAASDKTSGALEKNAEAMGAFGQVVQALERLINKHT